jgi:hypothetical protein
LGAPGINRLIRLDGTVEALGLLAQFKFYRGIKFKSKRQGGGFGIEGGSEIVV